MRSSSFDRPRTHHRCRLALRDPRGRFGIRLDHRQGAPGHPVPLAPVALRVLVRDMAVGGAHRWLAYGLPVVAAVRRFRLPRGVTPTAAAIRTSIKQGERKRGGDAAEALVRADCKRRGFVMVEQVHTPFGVTEDGRRYAKAKVSGDIRAVLPPHGTSVLIEVKKRDHTLAWSDLAHSDGSHQSDELDAHRNAGGITEIAWVDRGSLHSIPWHRFREIGFGPRLSVTWTGNDIAITKPARKATHKKDQL